MPDIESYLRGLNIPNSAKADLWDMYEGSSSPDDLAGKISGYNVGSSVKADLWDLKAGKYKPPSSDVARPAMPATPDPAGWRDTKAFLDMRTAAPPMPKPPVPFNLRPGIPQPSRRSDVPDVGFAAGNTGEGLRRMGESQSAGLREATVGLGQLTGSNQPLEKRALGASRVFRGGMQAAAPVLAPAIGMAAIAAPAATATSMALGLAAQEGTERALKAAGVKEGFARAAGDIAGLPGYLYGPFRALRPKIPKIETGGDFDFEKRVDEFVAPVMDDVADEVAPAAAIAEPVAVPPPQPPIFQQHLYPRPGFQSTGTTRTAEAIPFGTAGENVKTIQDPGAWRLKPPKAKSAKLEPDAPAQRIDPEPPRTPEASPAIPDAPPQPQVAPDASIPAAPVARPTPSSVADVVRENGGNGNIPVTVRDLKSAGLTDQQIMDSVGADKGIAPLESHLHPEHPDVRSNPQDYVVSNGRAYNAVLEVPKSEPAKLEPVTQGNEAVPIPAAGSSAQPPVQAPLAIPAARAAMRTKKPAVPAAKQADARESVIQAIRKRMTGDGDAITIADIKDEVGEAIAGKVDDILLDMQKSGDISLQTIANPRDVTTRIRDGALYVGDNPRHVIYPISQFGKAAAKPTVPAADPVPAATVRADQPKPEVTPATSGPVDYHRRGRDAAAAKGTMSEAWARQNFQGTQDEKIAAQRQFVEGYKQGPLSKQELRAEKLAAQEAAKANRRRAQRGSFSNKPVQSVNTGDEFYFPKDVEDVPPPPKTLFQEAYTASDKAVTETLDRLHPLRVLENTRAVVDDNGDIVGVKRMKDAGVRDDSSGYAHGRAFAGYEGSVLNDVKDLEAVTRPASKTKLVVDGKKRTVLDLAHAHRIMERHIERFTNEAADIAALKQRVAAGDTGAAAELRAWKPYTAPKYQDLNAVQAAKQSFESTFGQYMPQIQQINGKFDEFNDRLLRGLVENGRLSEEAYKQIKARNKFYTPFHRVTHLNEMMEGGASKSLSASENSLIKTLVGNDEDIVDPVASMVRNSQIARKLIAQNDVAKRVGALAKNADYKGIVMPLKGTEKVADGFDKIAFYEDGVRREVAVPEEVAKAMKESENMDLVTRGMAVWARMLRAGVTIAPTFMLRNMIRDYQTAVAVGNLQGYGFTPMDWVNGFMQAMTRGVAHESAPKFMQNRGWTDKTYRDFLKSKGAFGGFYHHGSLAKTVKGLKQGTGVRVLKTAVNPIEWARMIGETAELAPRLGLMSKAADQGANQFDAGMVARTGTVDFERRGAAMRAISAIVPFLNPRIQGTYGMVEAARNNPGRTALRMSIQFGIPALMLYAWNRKKYGEEYDSIADYDKRGHFILIYGDGRDEKGNLTDAVKLPLGEGVKPFVNSMETALDFMRKDNPKGWESLMELALGTASDVSPIPFEERGKVSLRPAVAQVSPVPIKAAYEWLSNQNTYTGRAIEGPEFANTTPSNRFTASTPRHMVATGKALGVSPLKLQNTLGTVGGYVGRAIADPSKLENVLLGNLGTAYTMPSNARNMDAAQTEKKRDADLRVSANRIAPGLLRRAFAEPSNRQAIFGEGLAQLKREYPSESEQELRKRLTSAIENEYKRQKPEKKTPDTDPREKPLDSYERSMKAMSAQARARALVQSLRNMPTDQRKEHWRRMEAVGIITPKVINEMRNIK